jgi:hypothetical protein
VAVLVARGRLECGEVLGGEPFPDPLGDHGDAVGAPVGEALDDGALDHAGHVVQSDRVFGKVLGDQAEGRAGRLGGAEGEVPGLASHHHHDVPALGRARVLHQAGDHVGCVLARGLEAEGRDPVG